MKKNFGLISIYLLLCSCAPVENEVELMPIDYLTSGNIKSWKLIQYKVSEINQFVDCLKDDKFTFYKKSGKYDWTKGESKCYEDDNDVSFDYKLAVDGSTISINEYEYKVNQLSINNLEIEIILNGHKQVLTYEKQE